MQVFDRQRLRMNQRRARAGHDFLHAHAARSISERLLDINRRFDRAVVIGADLPINTEKIGTAWRMGSTDAAIMGDEEFLPFAPASLDLAVSIMSLHKVNDVPGALLQARRALKPDGLFMAAFAGGETLYELRESLMQAEISLRGGTSPRVFPFMHKPDAGALMQRAQFALPVVDSERIVATYGDPLKLMHDLRYMGEGNAIAARDHRPPGKALFAAARDYYRQRFSEPDGTVRATFEIIYMTGWAPHESQQKPLPRGSGKIALADALGTVEQGSGERP